jgi:hypothetical protein
MKHNACKSVEAVGEFSSVMKKFFPLAMAVLAASLLLSACTMHHACSAYADAEVACEQ